MVWDFLLDLVFPKRCLGCGTVGRYFCLDCIPKIDFLHHQVCPYCGLPSPHGFTHPRCRKPQGLDGMFVLAHYEGAIRKAIKKIKYRGTFSIVQELTELVGQQYEPVFPIDFLTPVPLTPRRERRRGFNQARVLAEKLGPILAAPPIPMADILLRTRETRPQFDLPPSARRENVRGAFAVNRTLWRAAYGAKNFCLVDDVATTGATIVECAKALKRAGAGKVWAIALARGR